MSKTMDETNPRQVPPPDTPDTEFEFDCYSDEQVAEWDRLDELSDSERIQLIEAVERGKRPRSNRLSIAGR